MFSKVLVGVDGSVTSRVALRWAHHEARRHNIGLAVVIAWHYPAVAYVPMSTGGVAPFDAMADAALISLREVIAEELGAQASSADAYAVCGSPAEAITAHADATTLAVVGYDLHGTMAELLRPSTGTRLRQEHRFAIALIRA